MTTRSSSSRAEVHKRPTSTPINFSKEKTTRSLCNLHSIQESTSRKRVTVLNEGRKVSHPLKATCKFSEISISKNKLESPRYLVKFPEQVCQKPRVKSSIASNRKADSSNRNIKNSQTHPFAISGVTVEDSSENLKKKKHQSPRERRKCSSLAITSRHLSKPSSEIIGNVTRTRMLKHFDPVQRNLGECIKTSHIPRPRPSYIYSSSKGKDSYLKNKSPKETNQLECGRINATPYRPGQFDTNYKKSVKKYQHTREVRRTDSPVSPIQYNTFPKRNVKSPVVEISDMKSSTCNECSNPELSLRCLQMYLAEKKPVTNSRFRNNRHHPCMRHANKLAVMPVGGSFVESPRRFLSRLILDRTKSLTSLFEANATTSSVKIRRNGSLQNLNRDKPESRSGKFWRKIPLSDSKSALVLKRPAEDTEGYHQRVVEIHHSRKKSARFKNLLYFFTNLERIGELERITSRWYLPPILGSQQNMNYDLWKQIRSKERANRELKALYEKVKSAKLDNDIVLCATDVDKFKWRGDFVLRRKHRSVESIREQFQKLGSDKEAKRSAQRRFLTCSDRPLSRNTSVMNITKRFSDDTRHKGTCKKISSSLSLEQVTALKNELNEIYESGKRAAKDSTMSNSTEFIGTSRNDVKCNIDARMKKKQFEDKKRTNTGNSQVGHDVIVSLQRQFSGDRDNRKNLHVRCNSMSAVTPQKGYNSMNRRGSISRMASNEKSKMIDKTVKMQELFPDLKSHPKIQQIIGSAGEDTAPAGSTSKTIDYTPQSKHVELKTKDEDVSNNVKEKRNHLLRFRFPNNFFSTQKSRIENTMKNRSKKNESSECKSPVKEAAETAPNVASTSEIDNTIDSDGKCEPQKSESVMQTCQMFEKKDKSKWSLNYNKFMNTGHVSKFKLAPRTAHSSKSFIDLKELFGEISSIKYSTLPIYRSTENNST